MRSLRLLDKETGGSNTIRPVLHETEGNSAKRLRHPAPNTPAPPSMRSWVGPALMSESAIAGTEVPASAGALIVGTPLILAGSGLMAYGAYQIYQDCS